MPLSQRTVFKCKKCGYSKTFTIGDNLSPMDLLKKCPKCGEHMVMSGEKPKNIFETLLGRLGR